MTQTDTHKHITDTQSQIQYLVSLSQLTDRHIHTHMTDIQSQIQHVTCVCLVVGCCSVCHGLNCCTRVCVSLLHATVSVTAATVTHARVSRCCIYSVCHGCNCCTRMCVSRCCMQLCHGCNYYTHMCVSRCCMLLWLSRLQLLHTSVCLVVSSCSVCHDCNCCTCVCVLLLHASMSVTAASFAHVLVSRCCRQTLTWCG